MPVHLPEQDLSIFTIPKNGGTTVWSLVYCIRKGGQLPPGNVYDEKWLSEGKTLGETLIIRRDPVERFVSGYRNFRDKRGLSLGFDEFVSAFPQLYENDANLKHHFRPQKSYYPEMPLSVIDHVIDFHSFHEVKKLLEDKSGVVLPELHFQKAVFDEFEVTESHLSFIREFFAADYEAGFGNDQTFANACETLLPAPVGALIVQGGNVAPEIAEAFPDGNAEVPLLSEILPDLLGDCRSVRYIPNPGNAGDAVIVEGTREVLQQLGIGLDDESTTVLIAGGGNLVPIYWNMRKIIEKLPRSGLRIIILPHTVNGCFDLLKEFDDLTLLARERVTWQTAREAGVKTFLCHDAAFEVDYDRYVNDPHSDTMDVLRSFRRDGEASGRFSAHEAGSRDLSEEFGNRAWDFETAAVAAGRFIREINRYRQVRTDRLHVAIVAACLEKDVILHPNNYFKVKAIYDNSLSGFPNVRFEGLPGTLSPDRKRVVTDLETAPSPLVQPEDTAPRSGGGDFDDLTIVIKTLIRYSTLEATIAAFGEIDPELRILVVDDTPATMFHNVTGVRHIVTEPDIGVSAGRNVGFKAADTQFVLYTDDDAPPQMSRADLLEVLKMLRNGEAQFIGWKAFDMRMQSDELHIYKRHPTTERLVATDLTSNAYITSRQLLVENPYNPAIKNEGEHAAFFLHLLKKGIPVHSSSHMKFTNRQVRNKQYNEFRHKRFTQVANQSMNVSRTIWHLDPESNRRALALE